VEDQGHVQSLHQFFISQIIKSTLCFRTYPQGLFFIFIIMVIRWTITLNDEETKHDMKLKSRHQQSFIN